MIECWLPAPGFEQNYEVSDLGRIRSLYFDPPRLCRLGQDSNDYLTVALTKEGRRTTKTVHRMVALAFHAERRNILHSQVAHLDGNRRNAKASNLKWVSKVENESHKRLHGTHGAGEMHPRARLTSADVLEIRAAVGPHAAIGERYGVTAYTVSDIKTGKRWSSLQGIAQEPTP